MKVLLTTVVAVSGFLGVTGLAGADVGVVLDTATVRVGEALRGSGDGAGMPVYLVPARIALRPFPCHGDGYCNHCSKRPPGPPYVLLGRLAVTRDVYQDQRFSFRVPKVAPGRYRVALWCRACGGSLILAGRRIEGQVVQVRP